jgi:anthranilate phosphoribosyltransferase
MEKLGIKFSNDTDFLEMYWQSRNLCFTRAKLFHPAMKNVGPLEKN